MAIKKINTDLQIEAGLLDGDGNSGVLNQVLVSTGTGIDWVDGSGSSIIGGPYLPLSAGSSYPLTGTLYGTSTNFSGNGDYAGSMTLGTGASTAEANLQIGQGRTGNGYSYIDLIGDATYQDYGLRIIRNNAGANTSSAIIHRGTGNLEISSVESSSTLFKTNNTTALTLTNTQNAIFTGNVGIGTTSPDYKLEVQGVISSADAGLQKATFANVGNDLVLTANADATNVTAKILFNSSGAGGTGVSTKMIIDGSGNVGIGTTSPIQKLQVTGSAYVNNGTLFLDTNQFLFWGNSNQGIKAVNDGNMSFVTGSSERVTIKSNGNVGIGTTSPGAKLEVNGIVKIGNVTTGLSMNGSSATEFLISGADTGGNAWNSIHIKADGNDGLFIEKDTNNVGIGTTNPSQKLQVAGNIYTTGSIRIEDTGDQLEFGNANVAMQRTSNLLELGGYDGIVFKSSNTVLDSQTERMRIDSSGNVGIGTTSPNAKLHLVSGTGVPYSLRLNSDATGTWQLGVGSTGYYDGSFLLQDASVGDRLRIGTSGTFTLPAYNSTNKTGTPTYLLGTDASGNIVKTNTIPGSSAGPYLPLSGGTMTGVTQFNDHTQHGDQVLAKWGASNDLTIQHNGTNSGIANSVGNLYISNHADDKDIIFESDNGSGASVSYLTLDGSTTHAYFSNPGNVGIGTTNPTNKLHVDGIIKWEGVGTEGFLSGGETYVSISSTASDIILDPGGSSNVGIGTTSPSEKLHVFGGAAAIEIDSTTNEAALKYDNSTTTATIKLANNDLKTELGGSERMRITSAGNVGIGTTAPTNKLHVTGTIYGNGGIIGSSDLWLKDQSSAYSTELKMQNNTHTIGIDYQNNETLRFITRSGTTTVPITFAMRTGNITCVSLTQTSDERKKTKIKDLSGDNIDVRWRSFEMKANEGEYRTGVIAQELEQNHPEFVNTDDEGLKSVKYIDLLIAKIAELETRIKQLENN